MSLTRRVKLFIDLFQPNPERHGLMTDYNEETGKKKVVTIYEKVTVGMVESMLNLLTHKGRIGWPLTLPDGTKVGMIDVDLKTYGDMFERVASDLDQALSLAGVTYYKERTTNGGWHFWIWSKTLIASETMYYFLRWAAHESGHPELETFPSSADSGVKGRFALMPYAGANQDPQGLGLTYLQTKHGEPIPIDMLSEVVANPEETIVRYAEQFKQEALTTHAQEFELDSMRVADLDPVAAWEELERAVTHPPFKSGWARHDALIAFINLADRANRASDMIELLKTEEVWRLWTGGDGSRSLSEWESEIDRWAQRWRDDQAKMRPKHGIKHLLDSGWELGQLKKAANELLAGGVKPDKMPEEQVAVLAAELLRDKKIIWHFDPEYQTAYRYDGTTYVPFTRDPAEEIKAELERLLLSVGKGLREAKLSAVYRKMERNHLRRSINHEVDHRFIACKSGLLDWRTLELVPHSPHIITIGRVEAEWLPDIDETDSRLQRYLTHVWTGEEEAEKYREILQEYLGYCLIRETKMRSILEFHGPSSTGKTTLWRVLMGMLGSSAGRGHAGLALSTTQDIFDTQDWGTHFVGPTVAIFDEISTSNRATGQKIIVLLKTLAGGGSIVVNPKGRTSSTFDSTMKLLLCTNVDLRLHDDVANDAMFRRLVRLPFNRIVSNDKERSRMDEIILAGEFERERIFKWAVEGLRRLERQDWNLSHSKTRRAQMDESREAANPVISFLLAATQRKSGEEVLQADLRQGFMGWAMEQGLGKTYEQISYQKFNTLLKGAFAALGWQLEKRQSGRSGGGYDTLITGLEYIEID